MNTATLPTPASAVSTLNPAISSTEQDIANLRAQLDEAEARKAHLLAEEAANRAKVRRDAILGLPVILGVPDLGQVIVLIRREMNGTLTVESKVKRPFPNALSPETLAQMRSMLEAFATSRAVSEALKVGISTVDSYKAKWNLTHRNVPGRPQTAPRTHTTTTKRRSKGGQHFSPAKRARLIEALKKPNAVVSLIARREHTSRQALYDLRAREHLVAA